MLSRRSKKARSTKPPRKRKKIVPKRRRSPAPKRRKKIVKKRSAPKRKSPAKKRSPKIKAPKGYTRIEVEDQQTVARMTRRKKKALIDFVHAREWRETGLPTRDELYDYLKWGADEFQIDVSQMYRFYHGYDSNLLRGTTGEISI